MSSSFKMTSVAFSRDRGGIKERNDDWRTREKEVSSTQQPNANLLLGRSSTSARVFLYTGRR